MKYVPEIFNWYLNVEYSGENLIKPKTLNPTDPTGTLKEPSKESAKEALKERRAARTREKAKR